ncbi:MAG: endopeptidase La [Clostridia bacterium]|nr:endopeptidase La [Clostridia bacterium]
MDNYDKLKEMFGETAFLPIVPMRGIVAFPKTMLHLEIGRKKTASGLNIAMKSNRFVFLTLQKDFTAQDVDDTNICAVGTIAKVKQILKLHGDTTRAAFEVICRAELAGSVRDIGYESADVTILPEKELFADDSTEADALIRKTRDTFDDMLAVMEKISPDVPANVMMKNEAGELADYIAQNIRISFEDKQRLLEQLDPAERLYDIITVMKRETEMILLEKKIDTKVGMRLNKNQHDFVIREQIRALQEELGEQGGADGVYDDEDNEYYDKIDALTLPEENREKLLKEVTRLMKMPSASQEAAVIRLYLDECIELPWGKFTQDTLSVPRAEKILNDDHYGLTKVKERILEVLAVRQMTEGLPRQEGSRAQILCLVGPPGTGKTSIAMSVAKALNRNFARISLGGIHDEAEIRGHRKTYIGSMPGRIINAIKEAKSCNPVILLDEIDKLGSDYKGDPSAALLEVLDPEQNKSFRDNFIDMPFDLSSVFFITTANVSDTIPAPLLDRMDIIELSSYTAEEKFHIAKRHLLPKTLKKHGFTSKMLKISDKAIREMIDFYTREAGVRNLEREIASVCRKAAKEWLSMPDDSREPISVTHKNLEKYLGPRKFKPDAPAKKPQIGVVTGLAYTTVGGETMPVEVNAMEGSGKIELTGLLGDVMKESAHAAVSFIRSKASEYGIAEDFYKTKDIHIHVPEGAVPKDGPSAGVTLATALISELSQKPVRNDVAMTGEITLRGRVLPIGGLKEKSMAAYKAGMKTVIIPKDNLPDLYEVDDVVKENVDFKPVETVDEVIKIALA